MKFYVCHSKNKANIREANTIGFYKTVDIQTIFCYYTFVEPKTRKISSSMKLKCSSAFNNGINCVCANVAQSIEQLIRNQQVVGLSPTISFVNNPHDIKQNHAGCCFFTYIYSPFNTHFHRTVVEKMVELF